MGRDYAKLRSGEGCGSKYTLALTKTPNSLCINFDSEVIAAQRVLWARHRDEMLMFQKACAAAKDIEGARFFKDEARWALKHYRACCLLLPHFASDWPGDCKYVDPYEWPEELFDQLDYITGLASL